MLRRLPTVVDVAAGDDLEAITRHIVMLDRELGRPPTWRWRAPRLPHTAGNPPLPSIVVLIDDIGSLVDSLGGHGARCARRPVRSWGERLVRVARRGAPGRASTAWSPPTAAVSFRRACSRRCRTGSCSGSPTAPAYADHGVPADAPGLRDLPPGRGWWNGTTVDPARGRRHVDHSARGQQRGDRNAPPPRIAGSPTGASERSRCRHAVQDVPGRASARLAAAACRSASRT